MNFNEWFEKLKELAKDKYILDDQENWQKVYDRGVTPEEMIDELSVVVLSTQPKHTHPDIDGKWFGRTEIGGQQAYTIGPFDTKEECAQEAFADIGVDTVEVGKLRQFQPVIDADYIIDQLANEATDEAGEVAEDWLMHIDKESKEQLSEDLTAVLKQWLILNSQWPRFGGIYDEETIKK